MRPETTEWISKAEADFMSMVREMNAMGSEGWEAFTVISWETGWWVFFRRPREATS